MKKEVVKEKPLFSEAEIQIIKFVEIMCKTSTEGAKPTLFQLIVTLFPDLFEIQHEIDTQYKTHRFKKTEHIKGISHNLINKRISETDGILFNSVFSQWYIPAHLDVWKPVRFMSSYFERA